MDYIRLEQNIKNLKEYYKYIRQNYTRIEQNIIDYTTLDQKRIEQTRLELN